jgi:hypothetical protein
MWMVDSDGYYSSTTARYLTFDLPYYVLQTANRTIQDVEMETLANALAIGQVLNRIVILPKFHCRNDTGMKLCPLNDLVMLTNFDEKFANAYREHTFLTHPKVPALVKRSLSPLYYIDSLTPLQLTTISNSATRR